MLTSYSGNVIGALSIYGGNQKMIHQGQDLQKEMTTEEAQRKKMRGCVPPGRGVVVEQSGSCWVLSVSL